MLSFKKIFGRKSENPSTKTNEEDDEADADLSIFSRRRSSARAGSLREDSQDQLQNSTLFGRMSLFTSMSPFKRRNSNTSSCHSCHQSVCSCSTSVSPSTGLLPPPVDVPDENRYEDVNQNSTKMNETSDHTITISVCEEQLDPSVKKTPTLSTIETKIRNQKQNTLSTDVSSQGSLEADIVDCQKSAQIVPDSDAVQGISSSRMFTKHSDAATLFEQLHRSASFSGSVPNSPTENSRPFSDLHDVNRITDPACISNTSNSGCFNPSCGLSSTSGDELFTDPVIEESAVIRVSDITSTGISSQDAGFTTRLPGIYSTSGLENSETPVLPPRRHRGRGRLSHAGTLQQRDTSQPISKSMKSRSLSELYWPGFSGSRSADEATSSREELAQLETSTVTSGILSDASIPSVKSSSSGASSTSSSCVSNSEQLEHCLSAVIASSAAASPVTATATTDFGPSEPTSSSLTAHSLNPELKKRVLSLEISPLSSSLSTPALSPTASSTAVTDGFNPDLLEKDLSPSSSPAPDPVEQTFTQVTALVDQRSPPMDAISSLSPLAPSSSTFSPSDNTEESSVSRTVSEESIPIVSDPIGTGKPLRMLEVSSRPVTLTPALRYSAHFAGELFGRGRRRVVSEHELTTSPLARKSGLTLEHVMTPLRVAMKTDKSVAVADSLSPAVVVTEAESSQHVDGLTQTDDIRTTCHPEDNESSTASPQQVAETQCELFIEHCLKGYRTRSLLCVGENSSCSRIIEELLRDENVDDDYRLYELLQDLSTANQQSDGTDDVIALEYETRPLIGRQNVSLCFHLRRKKNAHIKIVCDNVGGKRRSTQLEIAANATCCHVIRVAMETFGMTSFTDDPSDYSLIQIDRITKEMHRVREGTVVADLRKDYFLLCKKEHLARTESDKKCSRLLAAQSTSCSSLHVISPTSPCQWNTGFSRLQQLDSDSIFDGDVKSTDDDCKQSRVESVERQLQEKEHSWNERLTTLQRSLDRYKKSALATDEDARVSLLQQQLDELTRDTELQRRTISHLTTRLSIYSTGAGSPEKLSTLEAELQLAENHLCVTSSEHRELRDVVESIKNNQQQQASKPTVVMTSFYDMLWRCATRCYLCHVTVEMSHLRQVRIEASDDDDAGDWLIVSDTPEQCALLPGDRLVEFNGRLVCSLNVGKFSELMTSYSNPGDDPCRIVVLRETLETDLECNSLSQDISEWMKNFN